MDRMKALTILLKEVVLYTGFVIAVIAGIFGYMYFSEGLSNTFNWGLYGGLGFFFYSILFVIINSLIFVSIKYRWEELRRK